MNNTITQMEHRYVLENGIINILTSINHPLTKKLKDNIHLFSIIELSQIYNFLKTWNLNPIYNFFEEKKKEMLEMIETIKLKKWKYKLDKMRIQEKLETENENPEEILLNF